MEPRIARSRFAGLSIAILLLHLFVVFAVAQDDDADSRRADILAVDLTTTERGGVLEVFFGTRDPRQRVQLLPVFDTTSDVMMQVPLAGLCEGAELGTGDWNVIQSPMAGDTLFVDSEGGLGAEKLVSWKVVGGGKGKVDLMLRKGKGGAVKNITTIAGKLGCGKGVRKKC